MDSFFCPHGLLPFSTQPFILSTECMTVQNVPELPCHIFFAGRYVTFGLHVPIHYIFPNSPTDNILLCMMYSEVPQKDTMYLHQTIRYRMISLRKIIRIHIITFPVLISRKKNLLFSATVSSSFNSSPTIEITADSICLGFSVNTILLFNSFFVASFVSFCHLPASGSVRCTQFLQFFPVLFQIFFSHGI